MTDKSRLESMDIYSVPGTKVEYRGPFAGSDWDKEYCQGLLVEGSLYTVSSTEVGQSYTSVRIIEVPGKQFNSVMLIVPQSSVDTAALNRDVELHVFGDDLTPKPGDERHVDNMLVSRGIIRYTSDNLVVNWNGNDYVFDRPVQAPWNMWRDREGKPYQADMEAHVGAYRRTPRHFSSSLDLIAEFLYPKLREIGIWDSFMDRLDRSLIRNSSEMAGLEAMLTATPESICVAALMACTESDEPSEADKRMAHAMLGAGGNDNGS